MAKQYWIGGFYIDLSRNQITQNGQTQTMAPKALAVLTHLAQHHGQVVSQDELLAQVWPETVVTPNTLQRCIAQLRKVLGDDGKAQTYIKTHAKQGYSLECDVRWHQDSQPNKAHSQQINPNTQSSEQPDAHSSTTRPNRNKLYALFMTLLVLSAVGYAYLSRDSKATLTFEQLRLLTATDDKEFDGGYSPDGQYIVFNRYLGKQCINKLWAKHINTQQEFPLTKDWGAYGKHSFSPDGKQLTFLATEACDEPVTQRNCYDLVRLDFEQALLRPQQPSVMLQCQNSIVLKPTWLDADHIALLQKQTERWKLIKYAISDNQSTDLYARQDGNLVDYAYSAQDQLIAVTSIDQHNQHRIDMLKPDGQLLSSHPIKRPPSIPPQRLISPSFAPLNEQLIFSTGRQLFTLSFDGQVKKINSPFADRMSQPVFHPNGQRLLMIKGPYDSDVVSLPLKQLDQTPPYLSFERSIVGEDHAMFQPGGDLIAFWSERSGEQQLWISDGQNPQQLTDFPMDTYIRGFDWAADGQSLLINANNELIQVFLDTKQKSWPTPHPVLQLYQWDSRNNSTLLAVRKNGTTQFIEYDLQNRTSKALPSQLILWVQKTADGQLIYKDRRDQFWRPGPAEPRLIPALSQQGGKAKAFVVNGQQLYAINEANQLWSYNLDNDSHTILSEVGPEVDYLTDINQTELLMTIQVAAKKEVVELTLK